MTVLSPRLTMRHVFQEKSYHTSLSYFPDEVVVVVIAVAVAVAVVVVVGGEGLGSQDRFLQRASARAQLHRGRGGG